MKKKITITLLSIGLILIGIGAISYGISMLNNEKNYGKHGLNGIYQNNDIIIKIYELRNNKIYFNINDSLNGVIKYESNEASGSILDENYTLTVNNNELTIISDNNYNGKYNKKSDYTQNNYYNDNYGNMNYLNSNYNGIYNLKDTKIYLYQTKEDEVRLSVVKNDSINDYFYEIRDDKSLYYRLGNEEHIITINKNKLIYKTVIDGSITENQYTKEKTLNINDIINKLNIIKK